MKGHKYMFPAGPEPRTGKLYRALAAVLCFCQTLSLCALENHKLSTIKCQQQKLYVISSILWVYVCGYVHVFMNGIHMYVGVFMHAMHAHVSGDQRKMANVIPNARSTCF